MMSFSHGSLRNNATVNRDKTNKTKSFFPRDIYDVENYRKEPK